MFKMVSEADRQTDTRNFVTRFAPTVDSVALCSDDWTIYFIVKCGKLYQTVNVIEIKYLCIIELKLIYAGFQRDVLQGVLR
jgi:hypothetical protein